MKKEISNWIHETMQQVNICKHVKSINNNINMTYNYITDELSFDAGRIETILGNYPHISLRDYVATFTIHELGHSLDRDNLLQSYDNTVTYFKLSQKLSKEEKTTHPQYLKLSYEEDLANVNFEKKAWKYAIYLNATFHVVDMNIFQELMTDSLLTYEKNYEYSKMAMEQPKKDLMPL